MVNLKDEDRIKSMATLVNVHGNLIPHHLYSRYIGDKTELWLFGSGLGDMAMMMQFGDSFLDCCKERDPELGRIMMSLGFGPTSFMVYKGDFNVFWIWGISETNQVRAYIKRLRIEPDLIVSASRAVVIIAEREGYASERFLPAVGRFFKPLNRPRHGYGYCGLDNKTKQQLEIILGPVLEDPDFEWISKRATSTFKTLPELNEWYNSKKMTFGMLDVSRLNFDYYPYRIFESLATGTPIITYSVPGLDEILGFQYPYQSSSREETERFVDEINREYEEDNHYGQHLRAQVWSAVIREKFSFKKRCEQLFRVLEKLK